MPCWAVSIFSIPELDSILIVPETVVVIVVENINVAAVFIITGVLETL